MGPAKFVGFCFLLFAAFGAGFYYQGISGADPFLAYAQTAVTVQECEVPESAAVAAGDYCAILTMPKSLVPFLERLKRNRLARDVVITPATVEYDRGRLTAVAKTDAGRVDAAGDRSVRPKPFEEETTSQQDNSILGAVAVYFLAGSKRQPSP